MVFDKSPTLKFCFKVVRSRFARQDNIDEAENALCKLASRYTHTIDLKILSAMYI